MAEPEKTEKRPVVPPPSPRQSFTRFIMIFLGLLAVWALFDPSLASGFAAGANFIFWPVLGFGGRLPVITILLAGITTTIISSILRDYFTPWIKMARIGKITAALNRERMDAVRKGNTAKVEKLREVQATYARDMMDVQFAPYKAMALTMFLFLVIFTWLRVYVDATLAGQGNIYIAVPWSSNVYLPSVYVLPSWVLLYSLLALPFGQIATRALKYLRFRRRLEAMGLPLAPEAEEAA